MVLENLAAVVIGVVSSSGTMIVVENVVAVVVIVDLALFGLGGVVGV